MPTCDVSSIGRVDVFGRKAARGRGPPSFSRCPGPWRRILDDPGVILLVEDNPNDVELTPDALDERRPSPEVFVVNDGGEALEYLYRRGTHQTRPAANPRVVLLDVKLPKVGGLEVLERIKTDPDLKTIPVVMLTSSREERDLLRSYDLGTNAYVVKPMGYEGFIEALREVGLFWGALNQLPGTMDRDRWT